MEHSEHTSTGRTVKGVRTPLDSLDEERLGRPVAQDAHSGCRTISG